MGRPKKNVNEVIEDVNKDSNIEKDVQELLNVEVDGSLLTDYQRFLIDSSEASKKEIVIDDFHEKTPYFGIEEGKDSIHLVKKKRKSLYL